VLIDEIVHTCSNEKVAQAAVASLGVTFVVRVKDAADLHGVSIGAFTARMVRRFGEEAQPLDRRAVDRAMYKADQPILRGLQAILERQLEKLKAERDGSALSDRWREARRSTPCGCGA
jgi:hypothetical protein